MEESKKRKRDPVMAKPNAKHPKKSFPSKTSSKLQAKGGAGKPTKPFKPKSAKPSAPVEKKERKTPRESRLSAKKMSEERKKKRKPNYNLEKELSLSWEKMRCSDIAKEERSKLISEALRKLSGKFLEIASSHVSARVLQTCVKYCSQAERDVVFEALQPHFLTLSRKKYAVHLVKKLLDTANKRQVEGFISSLHGHVASLLRHTVGSAVVDHAFHLGNSSLKQSLLMEMYSTELQLFKDLIRTNAGRLVDVISKVGLQKASVLQYMTSVIQPLLEKGIVDYSIVHAALLEYFTIADKSSATDVIQQLSPLLVHGSSDSDEKRHSSKKQKNKKNKSTVPLLVRMAHTREGLKLGILCIKHGSAKERKKIIKGIKEHIRTLAFDKYGCLLLICILSVVDDTTLLKKIIIGELQAILKELIFDKNGRRPLLELLHPQCPRYLSSQDLACLTLSVPALSMQDKGDEANAEKSSKKERKLDVDVDMTDKDSNIVDANSMEVAVGSKKDPTLRRHELLVESGLAQGLIENCISNAGELLCSNFGKEVIFEVAVGGTDGILHSLTERLNDLHKAIASMAALPKANESEEHVLENFHSSRTMRKLVLDCPSFAATLWEMALEDKCELWAQGHSCKVVSAFLESSDSKVRDVAESALQPLVARGVLKVGATESKQVEK